MWGVSNLKICTEGVTCVVYIMPAKHGWSTQVVAGGRTSECE